MAAQVLFTNVYRRKYGDLTAGVSTGTLADLELVTFAVGEGNSLPGGENSPPLPTQEDLIATGTGPGDPGNGKLRFEKAVTSVVRAGEELTIVCDLDMNEVGLDGEGLLSPPNPQLYEVGVFDATGTMAVYGTFPLEVKLAGQPITLTIVVNY